MGPLPRSRRSALLAMGADHPLVVAVARFRGAARRSWPGRRRYRRPGARCATVSPGIGRGRPAEGYRRGALQDVRAIRRLLAGACERQALVLVLDDLHWADAPSLRLLEFLAPEIADIPSHAGRDLSGHRVVAPTPAVEHARRSCAGSPRRPRRLARLERRRGAGVYHRRRWNHAAGVVHPVAASADRRQPTCFCVKSCDFWSSREFERRDRSAGRGATPGHPGFRGAEGGDRPPPQPFVRRPAMRFSRSPR